MTVYNDRDLMLADLHRDNLTPAELASSVMVVGDGVWTDMRADLVAADQNLNRAAWRDTGINIPIFRHTVDDSTAWVYQMDHSYSGGELRQHGHFASADASGGTVFFNYYWAVVNHDDEIPDLANMNNGNITLTFTAGDQYKRKDFPLFTIPESAGGRESSFVIVKITRDVTEDTLGASCFAWYLDIHYKIMKAGSVDEYPGASS